MSLHPLIPAASSRDTLLFIHASAAAGRAWATFAAPLAERCAVLMPDRLGYAGDGWAASRPASFDAEAEHLAPLLNSRPHGVHVVAHSYGAAVALQLALRWPERVLSLSLYEPGRFALLFAPGCETEGRQILAIGRAVQERVRAGRVADAGALFIDYWSGAGSWAAMDARRRDAVLRHMPKVCAEFESAFADAVPDSAYARLVMPVRLVAGTASPAPVRRIVERLAGLLPDAQVSMLRGLGHMAPLTQPERVRPSLCGAFLPAAEPLAA